MRRLFVGLICVLTGVGVQMVHSASLTSMPSHAETVFLSKHLIHLVLAVCWHARNELVGDVGTDLRARGVKQEALRLHLDGVAEAGFHRDVEPCRLSQ